LRYPHGELGVIEAASSRGRAAICVSRSWIERFGGAHQRSQCALELPSRCRRDEKILADFAGGEAMKVGSGDRADELGGASPADRDLSRAISEGGRR